MPIRSRCPHCSAGFKVDESYIGQVVVCTKCKNQYQVTKPQTAAAVTPPPVPEQVSVGPFDANDPSEEDDFIPAVGSKPKSKRRKKTGGIFRAPAGGNAFRTGLWLGLLLFVGTFAIKQMVVDFSLVRTNSATEVARLQSAKEVAINAVSKDTFELDQEIREMRSGFDAEIREGMSKKQEELREIRAANQDEINKINKEFRGLQSQARRNLTSATATNLSLLKISWWMKLLLDLVKIAGCFLVLFSTLQIVCDPDELSQVKTFATVCSGIVLTTILALSLVTVFG